MGTDGTGSRTWVIAVCLLVLWAGRAAGAEGPLRVLAGTPKGATESLSDSRMIVVSFDRPMVALQAVPDSLSEAPLRISPAVSGTYRWMGTSTLAFRPDRPLPFATAFSVTVPGGTRALDGSALPADVRWTFETPRPRVVQAFPADRAQHVERDMRVFLQFNQPVPADSARGQIRFEVAGTGAPVRFHARHARAKELKGETGPFQWIWNFRGRRGPMGDDSLSVLVLEPEDSLAAGTEYRVEVPAGFRGMQGGLVSAEADSVRFRTHGEFRFLGLARVDMNPGTGGKVRRQNPTGALRFRFSNPVRPSQLVRCLRFHPDVRLPAYYATHRYWTDSVWLSADLLPDTLYTVTLADSLADLFGGRLRRPVRFTFRTGDYPSRAYLASAPGIVEAYRPHRIPFQIVNVDSLRLQMARLKPDAIVPLFAEAERDRRHRSLFRTGYVVRNAAFDVDRTWRPGLKRNVRGVLPVNLDEALGGRKTGVVLVQVRPPAEAKKRPQVFKTVVQVTGMGVTAKSSPANCLVWVTHLRDSSPVPGAKVEVRDDGNRVLWSGKTGPDGRAETPGWAALGARPKPNGNGQPRLWFFAFSGGDVAFTASDWGVEPYRFGVAYDWQGRPSVLGVSLFTDRGIYRPGDAVRLKGILRQKAGLDTWNVPKGFRFQLRVRDPQGQEVFVDTLSANGWGAFDTTVKLGKAARLGTYRVSLDTTATVRGQAQLRSVGSTSFRVEAYRPAAFEVTVGTSRDTYVFGDSLQARIAGRYLFGAAMKGQAVSWRLRLNPAHFSPPGFPGFNFWPLGEWGPQKREDPSKLLASGEGRLDSAGGISVETPLAPDGYAGSGELLVEGTVTGLSRQAISGRKTVPVYRGAFALGIRPETTFTQVDSPVVFKVATVTHDGRPVAGKPVRITVFHRQWDSVRKAGVGGRYAWVVEPKDTPVDSAETTSGTAPLRLHTVPGTAGLYFIRVESRDGRGNPLVAECHFYATGAGYVAWARRNDDRVDLVPDRKTYAPGDTARVLVKSPFERARALVTLEREGVISSRVTVLSGTASELRVPILKTYLPNVFVSVVLLQGRTAEGKAPGGEEDVGRPQVKVGYVDLPVSAGSRRLKVEVLPAAPVYRPGETATVEVQVRGADGRGVPAEVTLAAVDAGVLNLTDYQLPNPFDAFYGPRPLSVRTAETRLHLVKQRNYGEKGEAPGGGGGKVGSGVAGRALRGNFLATAYWNPSVLTDAEGRARVRIKLPDNLTTWRLMAVAQTRDAAFGRGEATLRTTQPLLLQAALPRFARVGDAFEAGAVVHNQSGKRGRVTVAVQAEGIRMPGRSRLRFDLGPGESREVRFPFRAEAPGRATFRFRAVMEVPGGRETDGLKLSLPVEVPQEEEAVARFGETEGQVREAVTAPADVYPGLGDLEVTAASTAMVGVSGGIDYLLRYPYDCLEQRLSRVLPAILADDLVAAFGEMGDRAKIRKAVNETLSELPAYQTPDGGFSLWRGQDEPQPYASAYAVYAMVEARRKGYSPNEGSLERGLTFLTRLLHGGFDWRWRTWPEDGMLGVRALSVYTLALAGKPQPSSIDRLYGARAKMPLFARAFLLKAMALSGQDADRREELARSFHNLVRVEPTRAHFEEADDAALWWCWSSNVRTTAIVLQALLETGDDFPMAAQTVRWLLDQRRDGHWGNTQENLYALDALATYFRRYEAGTPDFSAEISLSGRTLIDHAFHGRSPEAVHKKVALSELPPGRPLPLLVRRQGTGRLFYTVRMAYYPRRFSQPRDEGMAVLKEMAPLDSTQAAGRRFAPGSLVRVTLQVVTPQQRSYVVVRDPLPAGFEAVNLSLATESRELAREEENRKGVRASGFRHVEMHDDRVLLFADRLRAGVHTFSYLARATTYGTFVVPPTYAGEMYAPEVFGRGLPSTVEVR